jgi:phage gp37-like protein
MAQYGFSALNQNLNNFLGNNVNTIFSHNGQQANLIQSCKSI